MTEFVCLLIGATVGVFATALLQANRNAQDRDRAEHAVKMARYYKTRCRELNEVIDELKNQGGKAR